MKSSKFFLLRLAMCICILLVVQANLSPASVARISQPTLPLNPTSLTVTEAAEVSSGAKEQQLGMRCVLYPQCPDCDGKGNVCRPVEQFFPGGTVIAKGKSLLVTMCRNAHSLDYCGGSRACMKKTRQEQQSHKQRYGGGCYAQCQEKNVRCVFESR